MTKTRIYLFAALLLVLWAAATVWGQGLQTPAVKFLPAAGYTPDTVVVRDSLAPAALVCAELPRGTVACRTVGELRTWVQERKGAK